MYYLAAMDCQDNIHSTFNQDANKAHIRIDADLTDGDNEFSYEDQSNLSVDRFLFVVYVAMIALFVREHLKKSEELESSVTPHLVVLVAMGNQLAGIVCSLIHNSIY